MSREQLQTNFFRDEFTCKGEVCCDYSAPISLELVDRLQELRDLINEDYPGTPIIINSGFRCNIHNRNIGSSDGSQHPRGLAVDLRIPKIGKQRFLDYIKKIPAFERGGIGESYNTFVHVDIRRTGRARW